MNTCKVRVASDKDKGFLLDKFDHFVAVDWSQKTMAIAHLNWRGTTPSVMENVADVTTLRDYLRSLRGKICLTFEETTTAHWLYLQLRDCVDRLIICDPFRNRMLSDGPKTDKIDAAKLCLLLRSGLLKEVFHSADHLFDLRCLVSGYNDVVKAGVRLLNQRSAILRARTSDRDEARFVLEQLESDIVAYRQKKALYEAKFKHLCQHDRQLKRLTRVEGIGPIGAVKILATVVDAHRFSRTGKYWAYCGLVTNAKYSGGRCYGRREAHYNRMLKSVYKIATLAALQGHNPVREYYDSLIARGMAPHNARHQIARYLARVTYGMLKTNTPYDPYCWRTKNATRHQVA